MCYAIERTCLHFTFRNEGRTTILRSADVSFFAIFEVDITEVYIEELQSSNLFQLFLDSSTTNKGILQALANVFLLIRTIREEQFQKTTDCTLNCNGITLIQVFPKPEVLLYCIAEIVLTHFTQTLREIVRYEAKCIGEILWTHLWNLPSWQIVMETVKECRINHIFREWRKQMTHTYQILNATVDIANEYH